jgi:hypothetical protein
MPPYWGMVVTVRARRWVPTPHEASQLVQSSQEEKAQLMGHGVVLQSRERVRAGHFWPPFAASFLTLRWAILRPEPHVLLQELYAVQSETAQLTGHLVEAQSWSSLKLPQLRPP